MYKVEVIQKIINHINAKTYLEIGVLEGHCFLKIDCRRKIAVDPVLKITSKERFKSCFRKFCNIRNRYFECSSNYFFTHQNKLLCKYPPDIIFIDGLHTYSQSLQDAINAITYLDKNGIIIMHDCNPPHESAAFPANSFEDAASIKPTGWTGEWNGDVWKTIVHLRKYSKGLYIFVLDCDYGLGIITRSKLIPFSMDFCQPDAGINNLTYHDLEKNRKDFLNLKEERLLFTPEPFLPQISQIPQKKNE